MMNKLKLSSRNNLHSI